MKPRCLIYQLRAWWILQWVVVQVDYLPYRHWKRHIVRAMRYRPSAREPGPAQETELLAAFDAAVQHSVLFPSCLHQGMALHRLLAAHGYSSQLRLGVQAGVPIARAHAWLERNGVVILDHSQQAACCQALPRLKQY